MFELGDTIGDYRVVSHLSDGGMASLFLGRRVDAGPTDPPVAIKVIHEHLSEDWQFVRMFVDEALISVRLRHPNVVRVDELGETPNGIYFLVMKYVHGCSLAELLHAMGQKSRRMRPEIALYIAAELARGLHAAHEMIGHDGQLLGIIHRDVSPQNVLLSVDGQVKLLDFGIAKAKGRAERTEAGVIKGKIRYMAPEQAIGDELDRRVDVYALGVVLFESLTMRRYIEGRNEIEILRRVRDPELIPPSLRAEGIDSRVDEVVMAALAPSPSRRPETAEQFARMLDAAAPSGAAVGPAHVAELLRVFMGDDIAAHALALPGDVGAPLAAQVQTPRVLPGESVPADEVSRTRTLTAALKKAAAATGTDEVTRGVRRPASVGTVPEARLEERATIRDDAAIRQAIDLLEFGEDDDEATVQASGHELAEFLSEIRANESAASPAATPPSPRRPLPSRPLVSPANLPPPTPRRSAASPGPLAAPPDVDALLDPHAPPLPRTDTVELGLPQEAIEAPATHPRALPAAPPIPSAPPRAPSVRPKPASRVLGWIARVALITLVAFAVGAGAAVVYVRFLR